MHAVGELAASVAHNLNNSLTVIKGRTKLLQMRLECNGPVYVNGGLAELREVVLNLIFNVVDAMPDGGI